MTSNHSSIKYVISINQQQNGALHFERLLDHVLQVRPGVTLRLLAVLGVGLCAHCVEVEVLQGGGRGRVLHQNPTQQLVALRHHFVTITDLIKRQVIKCNALQFSELLNASGGSNGATSILP